MGKESVNRFLPHFRLAPATKRKAPKALMRLGGLSSSGEGAQITQRHFIFFAASLILVALEQVITRIRIGAVGFTLDDA